MDALVPECASLGRLMETRDAVADLQSRLTHQQAEIDELTRQSLVQQRQIDELILHVQRIQAQLRELADSAGQTEIVDPPPPHY